MNLLTKQKETHRLRTQTYGCRGEGIVREFGKVLYTLLYLKWITCKDLLYSTGNSAQCCVPAWIGSRVWGRMNMKVKSLSRLQLLPTAWTVAHQASPSMGFYRPEYWSGLPFPSPGESSRPRDRTQVSPIAGGFFTVWATREFPWGRTYMNDWVPSLFTWNYTAFANRLYPNTK